MFKDSTERQQILEECNSFLDKEAKFTAFSDGLMHYEVVVDDLLYEFSIKADDEFVSTMDVQWLLDLKRVDYFCSSVFINKGRDPLGSLSFISQNHSVILN